NKGCVETEASTWNITNIAKSEKSYTKSRLADFPVIDYELIFRLAGEGDATAIHLRDQSLQAWSASAINLIHAYDPEILVLTGGIMASSANIIPYIKKQVETHAWTPWGKVDIREGKFPATAALLGIAHVVNNG
ncbi:ROK family protein, partial [Elizabethkingia anophelis]